MLLVGWWCYGINLYAQYILKLLDVVDVGLGQFSIGQVVHMLNFKRPHQIVAFGTIIGVWGIDKIPFQTIPQFSHKVDVTHVQVGDAPLMHPHAEGDQFFVKGAIGGSVLWSHKHLKASDYLDIVKKFRTHGCIVG